MDNDIERLGEVVQGEIVEDGDGVLTLNDFGVVYAGDALWTTIPVSVRTRQQAYRLAAYVKNMGEVLPDETRASTWEEVEGAVQNA